jgi:hypothetical protein
LFAFTAADATTGEPAMDVIEDFDPGEDRIELSGFEGLAEIDDLTFITLGADIGLRLGDMTIAFRGVASAG